MLIFLLVGCSNSAKEHTSANASQSVDYGARFLAVADLQIQDHSPRGHALTGVDVRARELLTDPTGTPTITIVHDSPANLAVSIENQCTASQCYLLVTMEYSVPDPDGFNYRYRVSRNAPLHGARFETALSKVCAQSVRQLHLWRQALDMSESDLKKWLSFSDRAQLKAALTAVKDRGLRGLTPLIYRCFADPKGGPFMEAVHAAAALVKTSDRSTLCTMAQSNEESKANAALKTLGMSGLARKQDLKEIHTKTPFKSVRVEASFQLQKMGESSDTKSSDTKE